MTPTTARPGAPVPVRPPAAADARLDPIAVRALFPALAGTDRAYLDSASTTQVPSPVLDAVRDVLAAPAANPGRGAHPWAAAAAGRVERARGRLAAFLGAAPDEVVLTTGATAAANAVAHAWGLATLQDGDEVLLSPTDHASTVLPWVRVRDLLAARGRRIRLVAYRTTRSGEADVEDVRTRLGARTRVVVLTHVHGVLGGRSTLEEVDLPTGAVLVVDATQSAGHGRVDVGALRADFLYLSAHKMFGLPGAGALVCRRRTHDRLGPAFPGGTGDGGPAVGAGRGDDATGLEDLRVPGGPRALESGSANVPAVVALEAAADFVDGLGPEAVAAHTADLTLRLVDGLRAVPRVRLLPGVAHAACRVGHGIVSFTVDGERSDDVGFALAEHGVDVRAGRQCLAVRGAIGDPVRASVHAYTTPDDVDRLVGTLRDLVAGAPHG